MSLVPSAQAELVPAQVELAPRIDQNPVAVYLARLSPGSRVSTRWALTTIAEEIGGKLDTVPWHKLQYQHTQAIRAKLAEKYAPSSANKMLSALRGVLLESKRLGLMSAGDYEAASDIPTVRGKRVEKGRALSEGEIKALFSATDPKTLSGARDAAMLAVLYGAGLRRKEVVNLDLASYRQADSSLLVRGKGNKERIVYLDEGAKRALENWIQFRGDKPGPLFLPIDKWGQSYDRRLHDMAIVFRLKKLGERAEIKSFAPHDMRRTFITTLLERGIDVGTAQKLAGHEKIETTARYDKRDERAKREAVGVLRVPFQ